MKLCTITKMSKTVLLLVYSLAMLVVFCTVCTISATDEVPAENIVPGLNIFNKGTNSVSPNGNMFETYNAPGATFGDGFWTISGNETQAQGVGTTFEVLDRTAAVVFVTYEGMNRGIIKSVNGVEDASPTWLGWLGSGGWQLSHTTVPAGTDGIKFVGLARTTRIGGVAVIPYYKAKYHISETQTTVVEFLASDLKTLGTRNYNNIDFASTLPTAYTPDMSVEIQAPAGYKLAGWSTKPGASVPTRSVDLHNKDIDLYPVFIEENAIIPGLNILNGDTKTVFADVNSGKLFTNYNNTNGVFVQDYMWNGGSGNATDGVKTVLANTIDRQTLVLVGIYDGMGFAVKTSENGTLYHGTWNKSGTWAASGATIPAGAKEIYILPNGRKGFISGIAVIPYYKATYHIEDPKTGEEISTKEVEFLSDGITFSTKWSGDILGLPTSYTPATPDGSPIPDGYSVVGWATDTNSTEPVTSVSLVNADIDLYPIYQKSAGASDVPEYPKEYGIVSFYDGFDTVEAGTVYASQGSIFSVPVSYVNKNVVDMTVDIKNSDQLCATSVESYNENNVLKIQQNSSSFVSMFVVPGSSFGSMGGRIVISMDIIVPADQVSNFSSFAIRPRKVTSDWAKYLQFEESYSVTDEDIEAAQAGNDFKKTITFTLDLNCVADGYDADMSVANAYATTGFNRIFVYGHAKESGTNAYFYIDNMGMYYNDSNSLGTTTVVEGEGQISVLTGINYTDYKSVGLIIANDDTVYNVQGFETNKVYTSVAYGDKEYTPSEFGGKYISAFTIKGITNVNNSFKVTPYVVKHDGSRIYGTTTDVNVD